MADGYDIEEKQEKMQHDPIHHQKKGTLNAISAPFGMIRMP